MADIDKFLHGAIDMHIHAGPDTMPCIDPIEAARAARAAGMRAIVLKNHHYTTAPLATIVSQVVPGIGIYGGVCLDFEVGGLNHHALEVSGQLGGRIVWMPTISSANSRDKMRRSLGLKLEGDGFSILDNNGRLLPGIERILSEVKKYDMVLASGHISPPEVFTLFEAAEKMGIEKLLITHASAADVIDRTLSTEEQVKLAGMGVYLEYVAVELLHESMGRSKSPMIAMIRTVGPEHCIISTDMGMTFEPPPLDGLKLAIKAFIEAGFTPAEMELMFGKNQAKLLGLD